jgi:hypothetical protein
MSRTLRWVLIAVAVAVALVAVWLLLSLQTDVVVQRDSGAL